jgi:Flp pilus assembly protein TadG
MTSRGTAQREPQGPRRARGVAAVEFVVTAPLMLLLMLACAELGRAFIHYAALSYAVRESARYVSEHSINGTTGVVSISPLTVTRARNIAVYGNIQGTGIKKLPNHQITQVQVVDAGGDNIRVTATYPYQPMLGPLLPDVAQGAGPIGLNFVMQIAMTLRAIS